MGGGLMRLSTPLEVVGLLLVVVAAYFVDWRLALAVAGLLLVLVGFALDRPTGPPGADG